jgi:hypothetical protein
MTEEKQPQPNNHEENSVASLSNNGQTSGESNALWRAPFNYITSLSNDERIRLVTVITIASLVLLSGMVVALVILVQFFDIRINEGKTSIFPRPTDPKPTNTPEVESSGKLTGDVLLSFQKKAVDKDVFRRDWIGPDGEEISSPELDSCLLVPARSGQPRWGQLLAQVMKKPVSARTDPFQALAINVLKPEDLQFVSERNHITLEAAQDGFLTFIINEAVFADPSNYKPESYPQPEDCKRGYEALFNASKNLTKQGNKNYTIRPGSIPLVWYSDNIGSFQVIVRRENKELIARVIVESTAGFQNSGIYLKRGEKVILEPDGRVHLALRQVHTFAGSVKSIIEHEKPKNKN